MHRKTQEQIKLYSDPEGIYPMMPTKMDQKELHLHPRVNSAHGMAMGSTSPSILSQELAEVSRRTDKLVDDVLVQKLKPLDVLTSRVPHCSMPAPEAAQVHVTTAYMYDPEVATAYLRASMDARRAMGYADCSTGPEVRIFDHFKWRGKAMVDSVPETQGFNEEWGLVADTNPEWKDVLHVDNWCDAQHVQQQGTSAENESLVLSRHDKGRRIWPVAVSATCQQSVGSSNAVKSANARFPWAGSGFDLTLGMSAAKYKGPGEVRTSLLAAAQSPSSMTPAKGTSSTATSSTVKDAGTSSMPPPSVPSSALTKAGLAGKAAGSQESTVHQAPAAKRPPAPKVGGVVAAKGPPTKPASDSAVMAKSSTKESQFPQAIPGHFPILAESMGKSGPPKKSPPQGTPKARSSSLSLKAAYASISSTATPGKGETQKSKEHYNSNDHRDGPGNSSLFLEECDKECRREEKGDDGEEAGGEGPRDVLHQYGSRQFAIKEIHRQARKGPTGRSRRRRRRRRRRSSGK